VFEDNLIVRRPTAPVTAEAVTFDARTSTCANTPCTYTWVEDGNDGPARGQWPLCGGRLLTTAGPPRRRAAAPRPCARLGQ
jgi:hypothetical protein